MVEHTLGPNHALVEEFLAEVTGMRPDWAAFAASLRERQAALRSAIDRLANDDDTPDELIEAVDQAALSAYHALDLADLPDRTDQLAVQNLIGSAAQGIATPGVLADGDLRALLTPFVEAGLSSAATALSALA